MTYSLSKKCINKMAVFEGQNTKRRPIYVRWVYYGQEMFFSMGPWLVFIYVVTEHRALLLHEHSNWYVHVIGLLCGLWGFLNILYRRNIISDETLSEMAEYLRIERAKEENMARMIRDKYGEL